MFLTVSQPLQAIAQVGFPFLKPTKVFLHFFLEINSKFSLSFNFFWPNKQRNKSSSFIWVYLPIFECPKRARQLRSGPTQAFSAQHSTHSWKCHRLGPCGTLLACNPRCPLPPTSNHSPRSDYPPLLKNRMLNKQTKNGFGWFWWVWWTVKKNEEKSGFGLVLLLSLVGGTEKKKKKKRN